MHLWRWGCRKGECVEIAFLDFGDTHLPQTCLIRKTMAMKNQLVDLDTNEPREFNINETCERFTCQQPSLDSLSTAPLSTSCNPIITDEPTTFDNYTLSDFTCKGKQWSVELWDTAGQESMAELRKLSYPDTDVFIVCYSVTSEVSLRNVKEIWLRDLEEECPNASFILVGCKASRCRRPVVASRFFQHNPEPTP